MSLRDAIADLPDGALLPVRWIRERLAESGEGDRLADLTVGEVAEELGRAPSTIRTWCGEGRLPGAFRLRGREWRVPRDAVRRMLEREADGRSVPTNDGAVNLGAWREVEVKDGDAD